MRALLCTLLISAAALPAIAQDNPSDGAVYFRNCSEARAAGAAPIYQGEPGYRPALNRDRDGIACE
jgi:hypothetical protein